MTFKIKPSKIQFLFLGKKLVVKSEVQMTTYVCFYLQGSDEGRLILIARRTRNDFRARRAQKLKIAKQLFTLAIIFKFF